MYLLQYFSIVSCDRQGVDATKELSRQAPAVVTTHLKKTGQNFRGVNPKKSVFSVF